MHSNLNNPFGQQPGKIAIQKEFFQTLSGQLVELTWYQRAVFENNILKKEAFYYLDPPLVDGRVPDSVHDIRECCICNGLFHKDSVFQCPDCARYHCGMCRDKRKTEEDDSTIMVCQQCADEANTGVLRKLFKKIWTFEQ